MTWTGVLTPAPTIAITYAVTVPYVVSGTGSLALPQAITNAAIIAVPGYESVVRTATIITNPRRVYLPVILKGDAL